MLAKLLDRMQNKTRLFGAMMARLGVDPVAASQIRGGTALAAAWRRCLTCSKGEECAAWLKSPSAPHPAPPGFCPNAGLFRESAVRPASWPMSTVPRPWPLDAPP